jgi:hypothetical protein
MPDSDVFGPEVLGTAGCVSPTRVAITRDTPFAKVVDSLVMRTPPCELRAVPANGDTPESPSRIGPGREFRERWSEIQQVELFRLGDLAEPDPGAGLDLADPLLGDPKFLAELIKSLWAGAFQAEAADDDLSLTVVEPA